MARRKLERFRAETIEIQGVLDAEKEDQLVSFSPEDFKSLEKEDRDFNRLVAKSQGGK